ncbi:MAG: tyrosine-type recombinase/integrase [Actinomycetota bacterium]|nr:tyrosine-type recombinase/integrase [Actinomycetota bacterium]
MTACPLPVSVVSSTSPSSSAGRPLPEFTWPQIIHRAPKMAATMARYLDQLAVSARPATVVAVDLTLRQFAHCVTATDPTCRAMAEVTRTHFEDYKRWLARRTGRRGALSATTISGRVGLLRTFFARIIEWGYDDAPARIPIFAGDFPERDEPLPKFLDDPTAAKFMAALAADANPRRRLMVEILARTGIRSGELSGLDDDAMVLIGDTHWLRIPVGKLHNDRYVPLLPSLVELIDSYRATRAAPRSGRLVERDDGRPFDRRTIHRYVATIARRAGIAHVHPHQLRHTLATQAINRGMSLEAIAALLGHRSMKMTLTYARITDTTIAEEYFRVTAAVEANYRGDELPATTAGAAMTELAADHRRLLGNGHCNRPAALDCVYESICERCGFFETGTEFVPVLIRQRDHAADHDQPDRARLFTGLLDNLDNAT